MLSKDLIIVVPRGTRVRYVESDIGPNQIYVANTDAFRSWKKPVLNPYVDHPTALFGLPVYDAEPYKESD